METTILAAPCPDDEIRINGCSDLGSSISSRHVFVCVCVCIPKFFFYYYYYFLFFFLHLTTTVLSLPLTAPKPVFKGIYLKMKG